MFEFKHISDDLSSALSVPGGVDKWITWFGGFMNKVKAAHPEVYTDVLCDIYKMIFGEHFNEDTAKMAVEGFENTNGTKGELINMMYSDNYNLFKDNMSTYAMMAKAWLTDPDVPEGKAWRYWKYVTK